MSEAGSKFFIIGIDGSKTPDPAYWMDRWECIEADGTDNEIQNARTEYFKRMECWLRSDVGARVKVLGISDKRIDPILWYREHMKEHLVGLTRREIDYIFKLVQSKAIDDSQIKFVDGLLGKLVSARA